QIEWDGAGDDGPRGGLILRSWLPAVLRTPPAPIPGEQLLATWWGILRTSIGATRRGRAPNRGRHSTPRAPLSRISSAFIFSSANVADRHAAFDRFRPTHLASHARSWSVRG